MPKITKSIQKYGKQQSPASSSQYMLAIYNKINLWGNLKCNVCE